MCGEINICNKTNNKDPDDDDDDGDDCVWHVTPSVQSYNPCLCLLLACCTTVFECCVCAVLRLVYLPLNTIFPSKKKRKGEYYQIEEKILLLYTREWKWKRE